MILKNKCCVITALAMLTVITHLMIYTLLNIGEKSSWNLLKPFPTMNGTEFNKTTTTTTTTTSFKLRNNATISRIMVVIGTRPDAIKCAPLIAELKSNKYASKFYVTVVSTGQHRHILRQSLAAFQQSVDVDLDLMEKNQKLSDLFSGVFSRLSNLISVLKPQLIIVQGDTTTALAAALAGAYKGIPIAHVEAGLRTFNLSNPYPEELNRKVIDSFANLKFAPTTFAREALLREGVCTTDIFVTGNTGIDAFYELHKRTNISKNSLTLQAIHQFRKANNNTNNSAVILVTMHRRENFEFLPQMCSAVKTIAETHAKTVLIILPVHPNPNVKNVVLENLKEIKNVKIVDPISFDIFGHVISQSDIVMTDSGGIQEEAVSIGKPVILMRTTTERPEGIYLGTIKQIGVQHDQIVEAVNQEISNVKSTKVKVQSNLFGDGTAAKQIASAIDSYLSGKVEMDSQCTTEVQQDMIAKTVYRFKTTQPTHRSKESLISAHSKRQRLMQNLTMVRPAITLKELLQIPSKYSVLEKYDDNFAVTAVIGMYRRKGLVRRWVEALMAQSHPPKEIWIVAFASPIADDLRIETEQVRSALFKTPNSCLEMCMKSNCSAANSPNQMNDCSGICIKHCEKPPPVLFVNMGEMQLKYFGRFQIALQCHTKYVIVLDDDCIPEPRYFETAMHTINTEPYRGILGTKGTPITEDSFYGPISRYDRIMEADVVGGTWFMESEWVKLLFHDKMYTWNTGEDWHLCSNARKYANIRSFVMPVDEKDTSRHSFTEDYLDLSHKGDTTGAVAGTSESRGYLRRQLVLRGDRFMDSYKKTGPSLLIFGENNIDIMMLLKYSKSQLTNFGGNVSCATSNAVNTDIDTAEFQKRCRSFHDFVIGRNYNVDPTPIAIAAEVMYALDMALQGTQSTVVIVTGSSSTAAMLAVVTAALLRSIPVINIHISEDILDPEKTNAILAMSTYTFHASMDRNLRSTDIQKLNKCFATLFA